MIHYNVCVTHLFSIFITILAKASSLNIINVPYPFGCSNGSGIQLNCSENGDMIRIGEYVIKNVTADHILVDLPAKCDRSFNDVESFYSDHFAVTSRNSLLLYNCTSLPSNCMIPTSLLKANLGFDWWCDHVISRSDNISCFSDGDHGPEFLDYEYLRVRNNCSVLLSSIVVDVDRDGQLTRSSAVAMDFLTVELGWWLVGECSCDVNADCVNVSIPNANGGKGYRCRCKEGFIGDGFAAGAGCRRGFRRHKKKLLLIFILPGVAVIVIATVLAFLLMRYQKKDKVSSGSKSFSQTTPRRISYYQLLEATDNYSESNLLGSGSFSSVYKGILKNGTSVAVKVFNLQLEGVFKSFETECKVLRNLRHRNLTKVIGSCCNEDFKALILQYMSNGSLEMWLYSHNYFLNFIQRLNIMIDVACALEYLHHGYSTPVVHCDLKPSNVLIDEDMVAHVSDFGITKLLGEGESISHTITLATLGYIAPEYGLEGLVSTRCDVYSFGIMMMEVFTITKPSDEMFAANLSLKKWVSNSIPHAVIKVVDANLIRRDEEHFTKKLKCLSSIMELALSCSNESPNDRINMKYVVATLNKIKVEFLKYCGGT